MNTKRAEIEKITAAVVKAIAKERKNQKLSLRALAKEAGVSQPGIAYIEAGTRKPTLHLLVQLCMALKIDLWPIIKKAEGPLKKK